MTCLIILRIAIVGLSLIVRLLLRWANLPAHSMIDGNVALLEHVNNLNSDAALEAGPFNFRDGAWDIAAQHQTV